MSEEPRDELVGVALTPWELQILAEYATGVRMTYTTYYERGDLTPDEMQDMKRWKALSEKLLWPTSDNLGSREGPAPIIKIGKPACDGCKHLHTQWWKDYLENDETDSGTTAECRAGDRGRVISCYWSPGSAAPSWCPFLTNEVSPA